MYLEGRIRMKNTGKSRRRMDGIFRLTRHEKNELIIRLERLLKMLMSIHRDGWKLKIGYSFIHY